MKVSVIGAGNVGATLAKRIVENDLADVVLLDEVKGLAQGKSLDLSHAAPIIRHAKSATGTDDYRYTADSDIVVIVNFSWLECARHLNAANTTDIAAFTYAVARSPGHFASQAGIANELKQANPSLKVVPWIGVWEYPARGVPIPSAEWVRERGMESLQYPVFDGVMFYPWQPSAAFFGATIWDVADDPAYISAFGDVFDAAMEKSGNQ